MVYDYVIIGGGIVGLSTAYQLLTKNNATTKPMIAVLEKDKVIAKQQSSHNSGVIHSGIYYKPDTTKAKNCIEGYDLLHNYCKKKRIAHYINGKIIVAKDTTEQPYLHTLYERANQNGLDNVTFLSKKEIQKKEPNINGIEGLHVPQTGIIDYLTVCNSLHKDIDSQGSKVLLSHKVNGFNINGGVVSVHTNRGVINGKVIINCAGLHSDSIARLTIPLIEDTGIKTEILSAKIIPFRGEYYKLIPQRASLINNLVYPVPNPNFPFLGVHFTPKINGEVEAGPNAVLAYSKEGYKKTDIDFTDLYGILSFGGFWKLARRHWSMGIDEIHRSYSKTAFTRSLKKLMPIITEDDIERSTSGVRAQACTINGGLLDDFKIITSGNFIHVINAPSPAATSSLSIGLHISKLALGID